MFTDHDDGLDPFHDPIPNEDLGHRDGPNLDGVRRRAHAHPLLG